MPKIHLSYSIEEAAKLFSVHRNTIRLWIKQGLPIIDSKRPTVILGRELAAFLRKRRAKRRSPCGPGEIYCVRCRKPRSPAGDMAEYQPLTSISGNLVGICPLCEALMYRRVNAAGLEHVRGNMQVAIRQAQQHINESTYPSVNSDLEKAPDDAVIQLS